MTYFSLIINNFRYYLKANILVISGIAISAAVLTGALIIGDSVFYSLEQSTFYRLGNISHTVSSADRYFREDLAEEVAVEGRFIVAPALILDGMAVSEGGNDRVNKVQVVGVNDNFEKIANSKIYSNLSGNEVVLSDNLAYRLHLKKGDRFIVRIKKASLAPLNAPFISDAETNASFQATVKEISGQKTLGFFNLKNVQTAPYNLFLSLSKLNSLMKFKEKANWLLISAPSFNSQQITETLNRCFKTEDAGLTVKDIPVTNETEISSDRIFIENQVIKAFEPLKNSRCVLTYFANSLEFNGKKTPYSFISTIDDKTLVSNDIIINNWVADDLNVKQGDSILVKYYVIGPLRQLVEKGMKFSIKKIVSIEGKFGDRDLMPLLPGLSNAGHCRDWETGVPIKLEYIRPKDEAYWNKYKGTPKAFISTSKAQQIWSNRFGNVTAIRIDKHSFNNSGYLSLFRTSVKPKNLGIIVTSVKENGLKAAHNGVDFSQLFLGLSFFLLVATLFLNALLMLLNLESRKSELGSLLSIGFTKKQMRILFLTEGFGISVLGGLAGLFISIIYTKLIFWALNTLWWDAIHSSILMMDLKASTLGLGLILSIVISLTTVFAAIQGSFKKQAAELQRQRDNSQKPLMRNIKLGAIFLTIIPALGLVIFQLIYSPVLNSSKFFLSGSLLLTGLLLIADIVLRYNPEKVDYRLSFQKFNQRNRSQNTGRSSTILILFSLGTFIVISTGANSGNPLSEGNANSSGTGGYKYFAETSVPVLFSLNDRDQRKKEGIQTSFKALEISRIDGDDASCLNLNQVSNPSILGVDPEIFKNRFTFETKYQGIGDKQIWEALNESYPDNVVPAIADQTVIQWGMGKSIGDTLIYTNESGELLKLKLIAGLAPSVLQGNVLISNRNFLKNYPARSGSHLFLIDVPNENAEKTKEELMNVFRDYGWEMTTCIQRITEFNSVENTYLSIFLALGTLGLILGTAGLSIVLARSLLERKNEIMLMLSLGFTRKQLVGLLVNEYAFLLILGVATGFLAAMVAILPNLLTAGGEVSFLTVLLIVTLIIINGVFWIFVLSRRGTEQGRISFNSDYTNNSKAIL